MNNSRVPAGVPTGGQFATVQRTESPVALDDNPAWNGGPNAVVTCPQCNNLPDVEGLSTCHQCADLGTVTLDRYGQYPWNPGVPGTEIAFEAFRGSQRSWLTGSVVASQFTATLNSEKPSNFAAVRLDALSAPKYAEGTSDSDVKEIGLYHALPLAAGRAAERAGIIRSEMLEEAASEMDLGLPGPDGKPQAATENEINAFLARIDHDYLDEIAQNAREYRRFISEHPPVKGPALATDFDISRLKPNEFDEAAERAKAMRESMFNVVKRECWTGTTLVYNERRGRIEGYKDDAWIDPTGPDGSGEQPLLPWRTPEGIPIGHVAVDGTVTRLDG